MGKKNISYRIAMNKPKMVSHILLNLSRLLIKENEYNYFPRHSNFQASNFQKSSSARTY